MQSADESPGEKWYWLAWLFLSLLLIGVAVRAMIDIGQW
jgi:hypothetical protein